MSPFVTLCHFSPFLTLCHFSPFLAFCHFSPFFTLCHFSSFFTLCHFSLFVTLCHFSPFLTLCHFSPFLILCYETLTPSVRLVKNYFTISPLFNTLPVFTLLCIAPWRINPYIDNCIPILILYFINAFLLMRHGALFSNYHICQQ